MVDRFVLGTAPLGGFRAPVSDSEAEAVLSTAWALGVRTFDTAPQYGLGLSEERLGAFLHGRTRESYAVVTKVGRLLEPRPPGAAPSEATRWWPGAPPREPRFDFSRDGVLRSLDASLSRLRLDRVDAVLVHDPDDFLDEAISEAIPALVELREQGVVRSIGAGMNWAQPLTRIVRETEADCILVAGRHTLLDRAADEELLPACLERGVSVMAGAVLNSGILADPRDGARYNYRPAPAELLERARALRDVCTRRGVALLAAAVQFPLRHPAVTSVVVGARSMAQVSECVAAFGHPLPAALWEELEAVASGR